MTLSASQFDPPPFTPNPHGGMEKDSSSKNFALLTDAFLPHAGGSRVYYYNLYKRLCEQFGHSLTVFTTRVPGWEEFDSNESTNQFRILRKFTPLPNWKYPQLPRAFLSIADTGRRLQSTLPDLIHVGDLFPQGINALWAKRFMGVPYLVYAHGEEITQTDHYRYQPKLRNLVYRNADAVIAANQFARDNLIRIGVEAALIETIQPGVDCHRFAPRAPRRDLIERFGLRGKTVMLSVGRLVPHKGHSNLLLAMSRLTPQMPRLHYLIAGEGPEESRLRAQVQTLGLTADVTFIGKVSERDLPDIYNLCDFFALANREISGELDGFGMVFLEANAAGKPVLGGRSGGTSHAVIHNETGLLFNAEVPEDVCFSLSLFLLDPRLRRQLGRNGRARAVSQFSWNASAGQLNAVCSSILRRAPLQTRSQPIHSHRKNNLSFPSGTESTSCPSTSFNPHAIHSSTPWPI